MGRAQHGGLWVSLEISEEVHIAPRPVSVGNLWLFSMASFSREVLRVESGIALGEGQRSFDCSDLQSLGWKAKKASGWRLDCL